LTCVGLGGGCSASTAQLFLWSQRHFRHWRVSGLPTSGCPIGRVSLLGCRWNVVDVVGEGLDLEFFSFDLARHQIASREEADQLVVVDYREVAALPGGHLLSACRVIVVDVGGDHVCDCDL
jgi:hypothetical protein